MSSRDGNFGNFSNFSKKQLAEMLLDLTRIDSDCVSTENGTLIVPKTT